MGKYHSTNESHADVLRDDETGRASGKVSYELSKSGFVASSRLTPK
jgi:hypothetical protein